MLRVLDLFSGIGGFSLGLERTGGFQTVAFCEIEPFCRKVLAKHWPHVKQYEDVRTLTADTLRRDGIAVDVICGGFPCQDISVAGKGAGIEGERSGLWSEYARIIGEIGPQFVIVENVAALLGKGLERVLRDLAEIGYDAEWHCIPASSFGLGHERDRLWLVAYTTGQGRSGLLHHFLSEREEQAAHGKATSLDTSRSFGARARGEGEGESPFLNEHDGLSDLVARLRAGGNAVVPQIPELIGNAILASLKEAA